MNHIRIDPEIHLVSTDIPALLAALELVTKANASDAFQRQLNLSNCRSAAAKLKKHPCEYSANELRVLFVGIGFALDFLTGVDLPFIQAKTLSSDLKARLTKGFFVYQRLYDPFDQLISKIENDF